MDPEAGFNAITGQFEKPKQVEQTSATIDEPKPADLTEKQKIL